MSKINFVTYGDDKFIQSRNRIAEEAMHSGMFSNARIETPASLMSYELWVQSLACSERFKALTKKPRGGGYWAWKPFVVQRNLLALEEGDFLVYADAGCTIKPNLPALEEYCKTICRAHTNVMAFKIPFWEKNWTKRDLFIHLNCDEEHWYRETQQLAATFLIAQNTKSTRSMVNIWRGIAVNHPHLFDDTPSKSENFPNFKEHRHDQSVYSLLCKKHGAALSHKSIRVSCDDNPIIAPTRIKE